MEGEIKILKESLDDQTKKVKSLETENQDLKDEIERLKKMAGDPKLKENIINAFQKLIEPEVKNAVALKNCAEDATGRITRPIDSSPRKFTEPFDIIEYLYDIANKTTDNVDMISDQVLKFKKTML